MRGVLLLNGESVYSVLSRQAFFSRWLRLVKYGTDSLAFLARKIRKLVPNDTKNLGWLKAFKSAIKKLKPKDCCYQSHKRYIPQFGFVYYYLRYESYLHLCHQVLCLSAINGTLYNFPLNNISKIIEQGIGVLISWWRFIYLNRIFYF